FVGALESNSVGGVGSENCQKGLSYRISEHRKEEKGIGRNIYMEKQFYRKGKLRVFSCILI
ncbi:hypothetical protein, partial [Chryseobacterium sp. YIM B08800]|uniref:hypothetical protein n=1 Tax=Chryseobacterium sp. YIM B08800 TaxID=2984136 RepID=UPI00223EEE9B